MKINNLNVFYQIDIEICKGLYEISKREIYGRVCERKLFLKKESVFCYVLFKIFQNSKKLMV